MSTKVQSLQDAVGEHVRSGTHVALCGFAITRNAVEAARAIAACGVRDLTLTQVIGGLETDLLVAAGCVRKLVYSGGSLDRFGSLHAVNRAIANGALEHEEYSTLSLTLRLHAGALGLPFIPTLSMLGSHLLRPVVDRGAATIASDPFTGRDALVLAPLRPDLAIAHVDVADTDGNALISGPSWALRETVFAASRVLLTAERVVSRGTLDADNVLIPGAAVTTVVEAPNGACPTAVYGLYDYDADTLRAYAAGSASADDTAVALVEDRLARAGDRR